MKSNFTLGILISLGLFLSACNKGAEPPKGERTHPTAAASPAPHPEYKQEYKGIVITVREIQREEKHEEAGESIEPSKPGNNLALIVLRLQPSKDDTIKLNDSSRSGFIFSTTEGSVTLKTASLAYDAQGNKLRSLDLSTTPGGRESKEFSLEYLFELPRTSQLKTLQFDDFPLDLEKVTNK